MVTGFFIIRLLPPQVSVGSSENVSLEVFDDVPYAIYRLEGNKPMTKKRLGRCPCRFFKFADIG